MDKLGGLIERHLGRRFLNNVDYNDDKEDDNDDDDDVDDN